MDPQIARVYGSAGWAATHYSSLIEELKRAGDAFGLHTHAWRWNEISSEWVADLADQQWIDQCLRTAFNAFRESFHQPCLYSRFGDRWMNNATYHLVEKLGARFDLTLEPGLIGGPLEKPFTGSLPDCGRVPRHPYRPSKTDFRIPAPYLKRRLWAIPLSAGTTNWLPDRFAARALNSGANNGDNRSQSGFDSSSKPTGESHEGYLDTVDSQYISGWAYDRRNPNTPVDVEVFDGEELLAIARAGTFRSDLLAAGKGDGKHSFNIPLPSWMKDGTPHVIRAKVAGTAFCLNHSPKELACIEKGGSEEYMTLNLSFDAWLQCRIIDEILSSKRDRYLAMVVRSEAGIDALQLSNMEQIFDHILRHPLIGQLAFVTPDKVIKRRL
jgi:hypothetical protein